MKIIKKWILSHKQWNLIIILATIYINNLYNLYKTMCLRIKNKCCLYLKLIFKRFCN